MKSKGLSYKQAIILFAKDPMGCHTITCVPQECPLYVDPLCDDHIAVGPDRCYAIHQACKGYIKKHPQEFPIDELVEEFL